MCSNSPRMFFVVLLVSVAVLTCSTEAKGVLRNEGTGEICPEKFNNVCPEVDGEYPVYIPLPNCTQFCQCSNGIPYLHNCPGGLHFNPVLNVCDWPENADCEGGNGTVTTTKSSGGGEATPYLTTEESGGNPTSSPATTQSSETTTENSGTGELCPNSVDNVCAEVDGEHPVYIPLSNCTQFCQCSNGIPYLHNCPGGLHFNPVLNVCDWPENAGCEGGNGTVTTTESSGGGETTPSLTTEESGGNPTSSPATTQSSETTTENGGAGEICPITADNVCPEVDGEYPVYIPLPNCTQFCQCSNGIPYLHNCPGGLHFNPVLNVCDWPENAGCEGGNGTVTTTESSGGGETTPSLTTEESGGNPTSSPATTQSSETTTENGGTGELCPNSVDNVCPEVDGEHPVYIPLPNCTQFCQCSNGIPYLHNCPGGLHFNSVLNVCDWPENAGCEGGNGTVTTTESSGGGETTPSLTSEENGGNPTSSPATTLSSETTTENGGTGELCPNSVDNVCPEVDGEHPVYIPLTNCTQFCQCSNGIPYLHNCPGGLHFNPVLNVCDWPENAGCEGGNGTVTTTESSGGGETTPSLTTEESGGNPTSTPATTQSSETTTENGGTGELCPISFDNVCPEVDGEHPVYIPLPNCTQFCQCSNGIPYLHNCPGGLHFNPVLNVCDWPENAGCEGGNGTVTTTESSGGGETTPSLTTEESGGNPTSSPATTQSSETTTENGGTGEICPNTVDNVCPEVDGEYPVYIPLPNCTQFCQCSNGIPYLHNCPGGLHFNPVLNVCDWPENAGCEGGNGTVTTTESSGGGETTPSLTTEESGGNPTSSPVTTQSSEATTENDGTEEICPNTVDNVCPEVDGEHPVYIPLPNCTQFCQCSNGIPYLHNCPGGLHFNPVLNVCDWPENAGCEGGNGTVTTTESSGDGEITPSLTTEESGGNPTSSPVTTQSSETTTENGETVELCPNSVDNVCPEVDGEHPVYIPLPNCTQFCQCSNGIPYLHNCPGGLHFNPVLNVCDWPENAGCEGGNGTVTTTESSEGGETTPSLTTEENGGNPTSSPATTQSSETTTENGGTGELCPNSVDNVCPEVDGEHPVYIPLTNCTQFCQCSNGIPYLHNCPSGLHFNPVLNVCDWPENAGCEGGNGTVTTTEISGGGETTPSLTTEESGGNPTSTPATTQSSETTTENGGTGELCPNSFDNVCPEVDGEHPVYIPLPNCTQFCQCSNGIPYLHNCPGGLHFNPVLNVCDWPENAGCEGGNGTVTTTESSGGGETTPSSTTEESGGNPTSSPATTQSSETTTENGGTGEICPNTVDNVCPEVDGEYPVYIPLPNCTQFCQCSNGIPYLHNCPGGLHFNPVLNVCDWPENAGCEGGNGTVTTTESSEGGETTPSLTSEENGGNPTSSPATTQSSETTTENGGTGELCPNSVDNVCPEVDGEHPVYIPLTNCTQFCQCSNGIPYLHNCPGGLHFNPVLNVCDWPENAGCEGGNGTVTTTESSGGGETTPSLTTEESGGNPTSTPATTQSSETTTENGGTGELCPNSFDNVCPEVDGEHPVYIPLPNCTQFCQCSNGIPYLHNCPGGLHFNPVLNVCDWPENAGCEGGNGTVTTTESSGGGETTPSLTTEESGGNPTSSPATTQSSETTTENGGTGEICPNTVDNVCPEVDGEYPVYIPLPNCTQFCQCSNRIPYLHNCPGGLHFNPVLNVCDWPENAGCEGGNGTVTTTESSGGGETTPSLTTEESGGNPTSSPVTTQSSEATTENDGTEEICPNTVDNVCPEVDGEHPVYIPLPNCTQFCQCSNGIPYLHNCPGGLHFNPVLNVCDWPENAGCKGGNGTVTTTESSGDGEITPSLTTEESGGNPTSSPVTTQSSETTTENGGTGELCPNSVDNVCPEVDGEHPVYIPLPNCTQFCQCSNGIPYLHNCPGGLHFNPVLNVCDWPENAGCEGGNGTVTTTESSEGGETTPSLTTEEYGGNPTSSPATTQSSETTTENGGTGELCPNSVDNVCPEVDGEHPVYIPLTNCTQFCQCSNGIPYLHNCPGGLHFNPVLNVCDWPENAGCEGGNGTVTTTESSGCGETTPSLTTEENGGNPTSTPATTQSSETTTENGGTGELCPNSFDNVCPEVDGEHPVYIPLPNCTQFCQCSNGIPYLHNCPGGLHFNPVLNVCDWPENAGCEGGNGTVTTTASSGGGETTPSLTTEESGGNPTSSPATTQSSETTTENGGTGEICPNTVDNVCPEVDGEYPVYIPLPNCTQFCQCSNGIPYLHNCPGGLHFNPVLNVCDWPENAGCEGGNGTVTTTESSEGGETTPSLTTEESGGNPTSSPATTQSSETTTENGGTGELCPNSVDNVCPEVDGEHPVYIPLPNCTQFCQCSNGIPYLHNCPSGLHFNPVLNVCDWPENAGCEGGNGTVTTTESSGGGETTPSLTTEESGGNPTSSPATTQSSETTTENGGTGEICPNTVDNVCPEVDGEHPVYIPHPNCTQFCQCSNGIPYLHNCPGGLHFNPVLKVCDWPENAGCEVGNGTVTTTESSGGGETTSSLTTEESGGNPTSSPVTTQSSETTTENDGTEEICPNTVDNLCPEVDGEHPVYIPLPNCIQFCQCSNGIPYLHNCPGGLHFNPVLNVCDWPENAGCEGGNGTVTTTESSGGGETTSSLTTEESGGNPTSSPTTTQSSETTTENGGTGEICPNTVDNVCPEVDGEHPVYIPLPNCTQFCQCSNGIPYLHNCPGGLHFNPVLNVCDWPENAGCEGGNGTVTTTESSGGGETTPSLTTEESGGNPTSSPATTQSSETTTENGGTGEICPNTVDNVCPEVDGEYPVYIPLPNCTQFCQCSNGIPYLHNCPGGLHFNPVLNVCDWPENAGCEGGNGTVTTTESSGGGETTPSLTTEESGGNPTSSPATTQSSETTTENGGTGELCPNSVDNVCPEVDGEHSVYIPLPYCTQFCQCSNGIPYLHNCPGGLHFNPVLNVCDWPENAGCEGGNGTVTTTESSGGGETTPSLTTEESGGNPTSSPATTQSSETTTENGGTGEICPNTVDNVCPEVDGEYPVYIPLPNCTQFCQCSNGIPYLHNCPGGLHFNPVLNVCDWPENAGCEGGNGTVTTTESSGGGETTPSLTTEESGGNPTSSPATTQSSETTTENGGTGEICPNTVDNVCPEVDGEYPVYIPLPNCTQFCQCSNGIPYLHNCPGGLHFNPVLNVCDWPENAGCEGGNGTVTTTESSGGGEATPSLTTEESGGNPTSSPATTQSSETTTENGGTGELCPNTVDNVCPEVDGEYPVYVPLPNCTQFCQCSNGIPYLHNCPGGLHFNPVLNVCDWPENIQCGNV